MRRLIPVFCVICMFATVVPGAATQIGLAPAVRGHESVLYSFNGTTLGQVSSGLIMDSAGSLYGTTGFGLSAGFGAVYTLTRKGGGYVATVLYTFQGGNDGSLPSGGLIADASGAFYGTTMYGGGGTACQNDPSGCGTVFKLTPAGSGYIETVLYAFKGKRDGGDPIGGLIADAGGALYGTTSGGGIAACGPSQPSGCGTVFKLTPKGNEYVESVIYAFAGGNDGASPLAGLVADANGALYGTTYYGGGSSQCQHGCGVAFKLTPGAGGYIESLMHVFQGGKDGARPMAGLIIDAAGTLYSTTFGGGPRGGGTAFALTPQGGGYAESLLHAFENKDGAAPASGLLAGPGGVLYGTTFLGGRLSPYGGTVFKLTPENGHYGESVLLSFDAPGGNTGGSNPTATLIAGPAGKIFGTTYTGGDAGDCDSGNGCGVVFSLAR